MKLTPRQLELLDYIKDYCGEHRYPPSYDEMLEAMGLASKSNIFRIIVALEERGFIRRMPHRARAIELVEPEGDAFRHLREIIDALTSSDDHDFDIRFDRAVTEAREFLAGVA